MKKIYIVACLSMLFLNLSAQFEKGNLLIDGSFNWNGSSYDGIRNIYYEEYDKIKSKSNSYTIAPSLGCFVSESLLVGIGISYKYSTSRSEYNEEWYSDYYNRIIEEEMGKVEKNRLFLFNPYVTKYHKLGEKLYFNYTFNLLIGSGSETGYDYSYPINDDDIKYTYYSHDDPIDIFEFGANITPGLTYFLNDKFAVNCNIGQIYYVKNIRKPAEGYNKPETANENFGLNLDLNTFMLGFQYYIR
ncbi:hypothetical protein [Saccharicrinis aurantiacus]|uniref:hypothetical protein n=1 Tax=Saccharicrinis aurantiacus TaxID=1849719 RepID=UPI002491A2D7|nr:hypothetical protein [Saccharicrinis aurantiacus]